MSPRRSPPSGQPGSQKSGRRSATSVASISSAPSPLAHNPPASAPALTPTTRRGRAAPDSSSARSTPVCAKKPKKPAPSARVYGAAASQS
nr:hypothetical protein [Nannocystis sp.]